MRPLNADEIQFKVGAMTLGTDRLDAVVGLVGALAELLLQEPDADASYELATKLLKAKIVKKVAA